MQKYDVLCAGSAAVDHFLTLDVPLSSVKLGDKVLVYSLEVHTGGGATNSAVALSLLGLKVKILSKLGRDHDGDLIEKELNSYKIRNLCLHRSRERTNFSVILSSTKEKDRVIYAYKGASQDLHASDFKNSELQPGWIYLASLLGDSFQIAKVLARYARKKKIPLLFNPSLYLAKKGKNYLRPILAATAILVLNLEEARALSGRLKAEPVKLLKELHLFGPRTVVITNGPKEMFALHEDYVYSLHPPLVPVVHTAGAGDAFTSGLLAGIIKNYSFEDALRLGQVNSTSVIQHLGTKNKLLREKEALRMMHKYKIKVIRRKAW